MDSEKCVQSSSGYEDNIKCPMVNDNEPIKKEHTEHKQVVLSNNKTLNVKIGVNAETGEKFLFTKSGQKLKVVQQTDNIRDILKNNSLTSSDKLNIKKFKLVENSKSLKNGVTLRKVNIKCLSSRIDLVTRNKDEKSPSIDNHDVFSANNVEKMKCLSQISLENSDNLTILKTNSDTEKVLENSLNPPILKTNQNIRCYRSAQKLQAIDLQKLLQNNNKKVPMVDQAQQTENKQSDVAIQTDSCNILDLDSIDCEDILRELDCNNTSQYNLNANRFFNELRLAVLPDNQGNMPIHVAVLMNDFKLVKRSCFLLKALQQSLEIVNHAEHTPLQLGIIHDASLEIIQYLLSNGASLDTMDSGGNYILHLATEYERKGILKILLQHAMANSVNLNMFNNEGLTALMIACINGFYDCADLLLEYGADTNIRDQISGRTALFHAAEKHDEAMVKLLLDFHANTKVKNFFGISAHDAMFEIEDMPKNIKTLIFGKNLKRKNNDVSNNARIKQCVPPKKYEIKALKTYARYEKIREFAINKVE